MTKISPGARFSMAVAMAGEVNLTPFTNRVWNRVTLTQKQKDIKKKD